jgi:hypothetical protein
LPDTGELLHGFIVLDTDYEFMPFEEIYYLLYIINIIINNQFFYLALRPMHSVINEYIYIDIIKTQFDYLKIYLKNILQNKINLFFSKYLLTNPF